MSKYGLTEFNNTNPVIKRIAIKSKCVFHTPALIGCGYEGNTDSDVIRYANGEPYLPGSTIAGVLRSLCKAVKSFKDAEALFGYQEDEQENETGSNKHIISPLLVYDAQLPKDKIIELDGVEVDCENKTAVDGSKFDYEAVNKDVEFNLRFLLTIREKDKTDYEKLLKKLVGIIKSGYVSFGAKTKRGFGQVTCNDVNRLDFDFNSDVGEEKRLNALNAWISFDWNNCDHYKWIPAESIDYVSDNSVIKATMKIDGSIMIRDTRNVYEGLKEGASPPDYKHISINNNPVILGTSWAGAFRSGLTRLLKPIYSDSVEKYINSIFGNVEEAKNGKNGKATVSKVIFCASYLQYSDIGNKNSEGYIDITRVKIDRFTGGAADGALFKEKPWVGGKTMLEVRYPKDNNDMKELILFGLDAINKGLIQIGGEASIGRGFFKVTDVTVDGIIIENIEGPKSELVKKLYGTAEGVS